MRRRIPRDATRARRDRSQRRAFAAGLAVSVVVHLLVLVLGGRVRVRPAPFELPPVETAPAPAGLVVVDIAPRESLEPEAEEPRPEPAPPDIRPAPPELEVVRISPENIARAGEPPAVAPPRPGTPEEEEGVSNASRLQLRFADRRLWFDPRDPLLFGERLARFARADSAVRAILRDWLDSLRLSDEQRQRALDWTFEKDGKRWGISPEGLHLGDITIPIPFGFAPSGPRRREFEQAIRELTEIQLQDLRTDLEDVANERREAMRRRSEEEARRRRGDTTSARAPP